MDWNFSEVVDAVKNVGTGAAQVYKAWTGDDSEFSEQNAYLRGQVDTLQAQQAAQTAADTVKVGNLSISTSSILWIVGGTLGLLAIGLGVKKLI